MYTGLIIIILIIAVLLTLVVLVQNSKGGGLASNFQSSNQYMGVRKTTDFLETATWVLAISLVVLSIFAVGVKSSKNNQSAESAIEGEAVDISRQIEEGKAVPQFGEFPIADDAAKSKEKAE